MNCTMASTVHTLMHYYSADRSALVAKLIDLDRSTPAVALFRRSTVESLCTNSIMYKGQKRSGLDTRLTGLAAVWNYGLCLPK